jgi:hypothetical protein
MLHHPSRYTFADFQTNIAEIGLVRNLRRPKHDFVCLALYQVNQAGIAVSDLHCEADDLAQHFVEREFGTHDAADPMEEANKRSRRFYVTHCRHTELYYGKGR